MSFAVATLAAALAEVTSPTIEAWTAIDIWPIGIVAAVAVFAIFSLSNGFGFLARTCRRRLFP